MPTMGSDLRFSHWRLPHQFTADPTYSTLAENVATYPDTGGFHTGG